MPQGKEPFGDTDPIWSPDGESLLIRLMDVGRPYDDAMNLKGDMWELPIDGRPARIVPAGDPLHRTGRSRRRQPGTASRTWWMNRSATTARSSSRKPMALSRMNCSRPSPRRRHSSGPRRVIGSRSSTNATSARGEPDRSRRNVRVVDVASGAVTTLVSAPAERWSILRLLARRRPRPPARRRRGPVERECRWLRHATARGRLDRGRSADASGRPCADRHDARHRHEPSRDTRRACRPSGRHCFSDRHGVFRHRARPRRADRAVAVDSGGTRSCGSGEGGRGRRTYLRFPPGELTWS